MSDAATHPDWDQCSNEIHCPLCDYSLRGVTLPRCPECGYQFDWRDLLEPERRRHLYLFEQHPRRNFLAFFRTLMAGWEPARFWRGVLPSHTIRRGRLLMYGLLIQLFCLTGAVLLCADDVLHDMRETNRRRQAFVNHLNKSSPLKVSVWLIAMNSRNPDHLFTSVQDIADFQIPGTFTEAGVKRLEKHEQLYGVAMVAVLPLIWFPLTYLSLRVFRWSMRSRKIVGRQVLRCVVYSGDAMFLLGLLFWMFGVYELAVHFGTNTVNVRGEFGIVWVLGFASAILLIHMIWRLYRAYRIYLRFPHALATVASSQVMVIMTVVIVASTLWTWMMAIRAG